MNEGVNGLFQVIYSFVGPLIESIELKSNTSPRSSLSSENQALCERIIKDLIDAFSKPRYIDSFSKDRTYAIIFRQSRSWSKVEELLKNISSTDNKIINWKNAWLKSISDLRKWQENILIYKSGKTPPSSKALTKKESEKKIADTLADKKEKLDQLPLEGDLNTDERKEVIEYLRRNWLHLKVFSEWTEVPMDQECLSVRVEKIKEGTTEDFRNFINSSTNCINSSTTGIFQIEDSETYESPLQYTNDGGKLVWTTKVKVSNQCLFNDSSSTSAPTSTDTSPSESPSESPPAPIYYRRKITNDIIYNCQIGDNSNNTDSQLRSIVSRALRKVNAELAKNYEKGNNLLNHTKDIS